MKSFLIHKRKVPSEIDLRAEMNQTLFGSQMEIAKGQRVIFRRMRRIDPSKHPISTEDLVICDCKKNSLSKESKIESKCPMCDGEGFLFDDEFITAYKQPKFNYSDIERAMPYGKNTIAITYFFTEEHKDYSRFDKIIEPLRDKNGLVHSPIRTEYSHDINMAQQYRADEGRLEYWRLSCYSE